MVGDTLVYKGGLKFYKGLKIKMGTGSMPDGDFKYARISSTSVFQYSSSTGYQGLANQANSMPRRCSGYEYSVVRIDKRGNKKNGYMYYPIINAGPIRYEIDLENAINAGEVIVPDEYKKSDGKAADSKSLPDELKKLKDLLDSGALTQEEYDTAKKKLLSQ